MPREPFRLLVLAPGETLLNVEGVTRIQVQLADGGGLGIYPGHAPLLAETVTAPLTYWDSDGEHALEVGAGILHIRGTQVEIFTSGFMRARDVSPESDLDLQFDRLARELMTRMQAQPEDVIATPLESEDASMENRVSTAPARDGAEFTSPAGDGLSSSPGSSSL